MIRSKIPSIGVSIFAEMSELSAQHGAINLSQGFPDFGIPQDLIAASHKFMSEGFNQYAPMQGVLELRRQISKKKLKDYGHEYDPNDEITITAGGTQALFTVIATTVQEGDQVIIFEPAYDSYGPVVKLFGGNPVYVELKAPDYAVDWTEVKKLLSSQTRLIILNTPHNPTGSTLKDADMQALSRLVLGTKIMILSDEVYEHIHFGDAPHESVSKYPHLVDRSFVVNSFGKMYNATGWKMGYCSAPAKLMKEFRKIHQFVVYAVNTPNQYAMAEMLNDENFLPNLSGFFKEKRNFFLKLINEIGLKPLPTDGTYFQLVDFSEVTTLKNMDLAKKLLIDFGVAAIPVSAFTHNTPKSGVLRFCFSKNEDTLIAAAERIAKFYNSIKV